MEKLTGKELEYISHKCEMAMEDIKWTSTAIITGDLSLAKALEAARTNQDVGYEKTLALQPTNGSHHEWMDFVFLLTMLFNRDRAFKKFTILRNGLLHFVMHKPYSLILDGS